ncbi:MAG: hypothetical protein ACPGJS_20105 [Flammeovirgaceae bacterium]
MRKIILFELNEVPFKVLDYFVEKFPHSNLAKVFPQCHQFETVTEDKGHLSPWITWPTLHRGVANELHGIQDFGENMEEVDKTYPSIWDMLHQNGISCGVFGSMHSYPPPPTYKDYAFYVPDPFAGGSESHPENIVPFQKFNLAMSRKSVRNIDTGIDMKAAVELGLSLPGLGIKLGTMAKVGNQLVMERIKPHVKTRRRSYQSILAFDVYLKLLKKTQPQFTTYFSNHIASTLHRYWAAAFPNDYKANNMDTEWLEKYKDEVDFVLWSFDHFLDDLITFVKKHPEYQIWFASSMGQKATQAEMLRTEVACKDMDVLISKLGLTTEDWEIRPAMHPQYNLAVKDAKVAEFKAALAELYINNKPLNYREKEGGFFSLDFGHKNLDSGQVTYQGNPASFAEFGLENIPIDDETGSTAYHIKEGSLFIYDPQHLGKGKDGRKFGISTCTIAPSILENFGITTPSYMPTERVLA